MKCDIGPHVLVDFIFMSLINGDCDEFVDCLENVGPRSSMKSAMCFWKRQMLKVESNGNESDWFWVYVWVCVCAKEAFVAKDK